MEAESTWGRWPTANMPILSRSGWSHFVVPPADWDPALQAAARLVLSAGMPMALMIGPKGLLVANDATVTLFAGKAGDDINGRSILNVLPESASFYAEVLSRVLGGQPCGYSDQPIRIVRDATPLTAWFNLDFAPVTDSSGTVLAALGTASEVTHHVNRIRTLTETAGRLRLALEGSGMVGIWTHDADTQVSTCDANVARMFGLSDGDCEQGIEDKLFIEAIHPDDRESVAATLQAAIRTGESYRCRYRVFGQDRQLRWVISSGKPAFDNDGKLSRLLGVVVDITDQMETAAALAESRFQFQTLTEALPQIVWSCDAEGRHDYFSERWSEFTGIPREAITEESWKHLVYPQDWAMVSRIWDEARCRGEPYDIDYRFRHHSGAHRWLRVMALPIRDDEGQIVRWFGTSTDIHDAYLMAEERKALASELERIANQDQLTEVLTRRAFIERATIAIADATRVGKPASLLMLDIDHFKAVNDTYGHPGGDKVLAIAAKRMKGALKKQDIIGRIGGEEFAVLLPGCAPRKARNVAERIRLAVEASPVSMAAGSKLTVTVSVGITSNVSREHDLDWMLGVADKALYQAKTSGRNRSIFRADHGVSLLMSTRTL